MKLKHGKFEDMWRGDGAFVSLCSKSWHFLIAVRWRWHFYSVCPNAKPGYRRTYLGPFEVEWGALRDGGAK